MNKIVVTTNIECIIYDKINNQIIHAHFKPSKHMLEYYCVVNNTQVLVMQGYLCNECTLSPDIHNKLNKIYEKLSAQIAQ